MTNRVRRRRFAVNETYAAVALLCATLVALVWANIGGSYASLWETETALRVGPMELDLTLHQWVDEGVMTLFFFVVGLDVRRELSLGELRAPQRAVLPAAAALGGLVVPALLFLLLTRGSGDASAWGTVISTDTAFALGMLALVGARNAPRLRIFLLALAVIDDIGALTVIALFYSEDFRPGPLLLAALALGAAWVLQRLDVWQPLPYVVVGVVSWAALFTAGVHATLAGVLLALLMPVRSTRRGDVRFAEETFRIFRQAPTPNSANLLRDSVRYVIPLNQRLSNVLQPYGNYLVVPLFALANAGVALSGDALGEALGSGLTWGVVIGLVVGKTVGITGASMLVLALLPSARRPGLDLPRIAGVGALSGMGFTISLLVAGLALDGSDAGDHARLGILLASVLALTLATVIFRLGDRLRPLPAPEGDTLRRPVEPDRDHIFGVREEREARVTVVVYTALSEEYREQMTEILQDSYATWGGEGIRLVYRHHVTAEQDLTGARALEAADAQGQFWAMHDALVRERGDLEPDTVHRVAESVGLDADEVLARMQCSIDQARIDDDDVDIPEELGAGPIAYVNGHRMTVPINSWTLAREMGQYLDHPPEKAHQGERS